MDKRMGLKRIAVHDFDAYAIGLYAKELAVREEDIVKALVEIVIGEAEMSRRDVTDVLKEYISGTSNDWDQDECF